jgi:preprotein translocase subunit SecF
MLFISWRFEWRMALASIAAMIHDVLISVGVYSVLRFEVTPATVVAFLTILGFSLYDTIVVFDKVRENSTRFATARAPYADTINVSMNQVLMRSLNTSLAAVLPVLSLLIIGSGILGAVALREFALALLVGLLTGSYSSIFIAAPLLACDGRRARASRARRQPGRPPAGDVTDAPISCGGAGPGRSGRSRRSARYGRGRGRRHADGARDAPERPHPRPTAAQEEAPVGGGDSSSCHVDPGRGTL